MGKYILGCVGVAVVGIIVLGIIIFAWGAGSYNNLVGLKQGVDAQWAEVQNQYQRRADLIPNLVQTVSGAANFEKSTLIAVTDARASVGQVKLDPKPGADRPGQAPAIRAGAELARQRAFPFACRLGKLSRPESQPGLSRSPGATGRDREPDHHGAQSFQRAAQGYNTAMQKFSHRVLCGNVRLHRATLFPGRVGQRCAAAGQF